MSEFPPIPVCTPIHAPDPGLELLTPPPREVPPRLVLNHVSRAVLVASAAFCLVLLFGLPSLVHLNLVNAWRLSQRRSEVPGTLTACGKQSWFVVFNYHYYEYTFQPPGQTARTGTSYGSPTADMEAAGVLRHGIPANFRVPVEYDPENPQANRIRGTSAANLAAQTLWPVVFLVVVALILAEQLGEALAKIRLLRRGVPARARVVACKKFFGIDDREGVLVSVDEFKERWRTEHPDSAPAGPMRDVRCRLAFATAEGREVETEDSATLEPGLDAPAPLLPVLYEPARPERARLLAGLGPSLRASPGGGWESDVRWRPVCLRLLCSLALVLAPACAWLWWECRG